MTGGIIDVHTHAWPSMGCFTDRFVQQASRMRGASIDLTTSPERYRAVASGVGRAIVFGGKAKLAGLWVDDEEVAAYAATDAAFFVPFMALDPTQPRWQDEMRDGNERLGLRGIKLMPMYAGFAPDAPDLDPLWTYAVEHGLPVLLHAGTTFIAEGPLETTFPRRLDAVATRFPDLRVVLAHLAHPFEGECVAVIRKHPNVFADVSALHYRPWQLFHSLMLVHEYGVWDKLLFGSDYPVTTPEATVEGLRRLGDIEIGGFRLPADEIEGLIYRDGQAALGLGPAS